MAESLKTFIIYASADREYRAALERQLKSLIDNGLIQLWSDKEILPGDTWDTTIKKKLLESELFLMLVSADFFNSDYIREKEFSLALEKLERGEALVVPIIVRDCDWEAYEVIQKLQVLPPGGMAVSDMSHWGNADKAWANVAREIRRLVVAHQDKQAEAEKIRLEKTALEQKEVAAAVERLRLDKEKDQQAEAEAQQKREKETAERHRRELEARRERLQNEEIQFAWQQAEAEQSPSVYRDFYQKYPGHAFAREARHREKMLQAQDRKPFPVRWAAAGAGVLLVAFVVWKVASGSTRKDTPLQNQLADATEMVFVRSDTFQMGSNDGENDEKPVHSVTISDFYLGQYEVTQKQWRDIMGSNPSYFKHCDQCPVENVSWNDIQQFLQKLNKKHPGKNYRLPTEAEWEYAASGGGKPVLFGNGKNVADPAEINFDASSVYKKPYSVAGEYRAKTIPVGSLRSPNTLGLHDMSGNVWEWCSDWYGNYSSATQTNPQGPASGSLRVCRGGSWNDVPQVCRVALRYSLTPGGRNDVLGFRLARTK